MSKINLPLEDVINAVIESKVSHPWTHYIHYISCDIVSSCTSEVYGWCHIAFDEDTKHVTALVAQLKATCKSIYGKPINVYVYLRDTEKKHGD